jgi:hypothetical protein
LFETDTRRFHKQALHNIAEPRKLQVSLRSN